MKRKKSPDQPGVVFAHRAECTLHAAQHATAALAHIIDDTLDQQRPNLRPEINRVQMALAELEKARRWLASAIEPL